ncbi:CoA-binding protein [Thalassospiraceae bacterium LMO-SO8]|nr:CoA-binding protein [Thalassospiraceae bacterium LMO-SO8]
MSQPADAPAPPLHYDDALVAGVLKDVRTIAMVGASPNWVRPSNFAMKYLLGKGYTVIPINPGHAGKEIWDQMTYAELGEVPGPVDMVDVFRASKDAGGIVDRAIELKDAKGIKVIWMQLGVRDDAAAARAEAAGITVIMDRCPKIEYGRLFGELGWCGVNSGVISAKRPKR